MLRQLKHMAVSAGLALIRRLGSDTELAMLEENLRLARLRRDEMEHAVRELHTLVVGDEPFYSWQRVYQHTERLVNLAAQVSERSRN